MFMCSIQDSALPCQSVYKWIFKNVSTSVMGAERLGQPLASTSVEKQEEARAFILADRRNCITTRHQLRCGLCFIA